MTALNAWDVRIYRCIGGWGVWLKSSELIERVKSDSYLLISFVEQWIFPVFSWRLFLLHTFPQFHCRLTGSKSGCCSKRHSYSLGKKHSDMAQQPEWREKNVEDKKRVAMEPKYNTFCTNLSSNHLASQNVIASIQETFCFTNHSMYGRFIFFWFKQGILMHENTHVFFLLLLKAFMWRYIKQHLHLFQSAPLCFRRFPREQCRWQRPCSSA